MATACACVLLPQGKLVSTMMKKHLVESVVPLLVELKHMLQAGGGAAGLRLG